MSYQATIYKILLSAPNDIIQEIPIIRETIASWNTINAFTSKKYLDLIHWKTHTYPQAGESPQKIINRQIVDDADILIAIFWTRFGTKTEDYESGTIEEIERTIESGKPTLVYFSKQPVMMESVDIAQYHKVKEYCNSIKSKVLYGEYSTKEELRNLLFRHISQTLHNQENILPVENIEESDLDIFKKEIGQVYRKAVIEWTSEEKSHPDNTDDAKIIISLFNDELINYRSMITSDDDGKLSEEFDIAILLGKQILKHQMLLDGGKSYKRFWELGNEMINKLKNIIDILNE